MNPIQLRELLKKIVEKKDERAFSTFFDHYHTRLIKLALLFVPRFDQAEEVVSEVFLNLLRKRETLLSIQHFEGYLFKMVKYEALNYLKSNKSKFAGNILIDDVQDYLSPDNNDPEKNMINHDLGKLLNHVIERLPPKRGLVFRMVKDENMSYKEVGEILEISERTVEVHLKLAIKDLRKALSHYYNENKGVIPLSRQRFLSILL
ncbi:RNA polymerase sigma factor [Pleomorphovibrio marinus]|uniref:RNA polymerase sigma factor n=1 Tax=Pleomorphovibrio marinus TaxID=2164132 RepID=UPI000E0B763F|nr:RNA polymerase sigma-70 factor [Pleomorphovibrio marinus]